MDLSVKTIVDEGLTVQASVQLLGSFLHAMSNFSMQVTDEVSDFLYKLFCQSILFRTFR